MTMYLGYINKLESETKISLPYGSDELCIYCAFHKHANSEVQKPTDDCVFAAVNHLNGPLRKQNFTLTGSKGHGL